MLRATVCVFLLAGLGAAPAVGQPTPIDSLVRAFAAETGLPSVVVGVTRGGERSVVAVGAAPDSRTVYEIGSISKVLTALALADAVVRGETTLETPLADAAGLEVGTHAEGPVRLVDLATHTSGLPRLAPNAFEGANLDDPYAAYGPGRLAAFLQTAEPATAPGTTYLYSNAGAGALGYALAQQAGTDYASLVRERVLAPLGMDDTHVVLPDGVRLATPHSADGVPVAPWTWTEPTVGAGGWRAPLDDVLTLAEAALDPDATPLAEALRLSLESHAEADGGQIGLGWHLAPTPGDAVVAWHNGGTAGSSSSLWVYPAGGVAVAVLTNHEADLDAFAVGLLQRVARE